MSSRLTKELRADIVGAALKKAGVADEAARIETRRTAWAEAVRVDACGGPAMVRKIDRAMKVWGTLRSEFPKDLRASDSSPFRLDNDIYLNVAGRRFRAVWGDYNHKRPTPGEHTLGESHPLTKEFFEIESASSALTKRREEISDSMNATLGQFHTVEKLVKAWPEVAELLPSVMSERAINLPMVPVATLNKLVGLPSEKPKAKT